MIFFFLRLYKSWLQASSTTSLLLMWFSLCLAFLEGWQVVRAYWAYTRLFRFPRRPTYGHQFDEKKPCLRWFLPQRMLLYQWKNLLVQTSQLYLTLTHTSNSSVRALSDTTYTSLFSAYLSTAFPLEWSCPGVCVIHVYRWNIFILLHAASTLIQGLAAPDMQRR